MKHATCFCITILCLLGTFGGVANAQDVPPPPQDPPEEKQDQPPVTSAPELAPGEPLRYKISETSKVFRDFPGEEKFEQETDAQSTLVSQVVRNEEGALLYKGALESMLIFAGSRPYKYGMDQLPKIEAVMDASGKVTEVALGGSTEAVGYRMGIPVDLVFPGSLSLPSSTEAGTEWEYEFPLPLRGVEGKPPILKAKAKVVGTEKLEGRDCLRVRVRVEETIVVEGVRVAGYLRDAQAEVKMTLSAWLDVSTWNLVECDTHLLLGGWAKPVEGKDVEKGEGEGGAGAPEEDPMKTSAFYFGFEASATKSVQD